MKHFILLATSAFVGLGATVHAQDVVVMRRTIASPNPRLPPPVTPEPGTGETGLHWDTTPWVVTPGCGTTVQTSIATCRNAANAVVDDGQCIAAIGAKPPQSNPTTSYATCTYSWITGEYGAWSSTCSASASHTRSVQCKRDFDGYIVDVNESQYCKTTKPDTSETTGVTTACDYQWKKTWNMNPFGIKGASVNGPWTIRNAYSYICSYKNSDTASSDSQCDARILGAKPNAGTTPDLKVTPTLDMTNWKKRGITDWSATSTDSKTQTNASIISRETFVVDAPLTQGEISDRAYDYCVSRIAGYYDANPVLATWTTNMNFPSRCEVSKQYKVKATGKITFEIVLSATSTFPFAGQALATAAGGGTSATMTLVPSASEGLQNFTLVRGIKGTSATSGLPANYYIDSTPEESGCKLTDGPALNEYLCAP